VYRLLPAYIAFLISSIISGCCDFIAQSILVRINYTYHLLCSSKFSKIYRCWIVWNCSIRIVAIPSILALSFLGQSNYFHRLLIAIYSFPLVLWLASVGSNTAQTSLGEIINPKWSNTATTISIAVSLAVNALVTTLIAFRIFEVYRATKPVDGQTPVGGSRLRSIMFIIIESGLALFSIQVARLVTATVVTDASYIADQWILPIYQMFNVIIRRSLSLLIFTHNVSMLGYNTYSHPSAGLNGIVIL
jgi:hypothetical protein